MSSIPLKYAVEEKNCLCKDIKGKCLVEGLHHTLNNLNLQQETN